MSLSVEGMCMNIIPNVEGNEVRFSVQDSEGIFYVCDYSYTGDLPLRKGDMVSTLGDYVQKISNGDVISVFQCTFLTARYEFDLFNFLMTYMPYQKVKEESDYENVTKFYRECTNSIIEYCATTMGSYSVDNLNSLFNYLYKCITIGDDDTLVDFARNCFKNPDLKKIKTFFRLWNSEVFIRPLQLLGLSAQEIDSIHIPLDKAYEIAKTNPYRLPQIPIDKAYKIVTQHLRLEYAPDDVVVETNHEELEYISTEAFFCGQVTRMVYENIGRKWTSTPIKNILAKFSLFPLFKEKIIKYYFCVEDLDSLYFEKMYDTEVMIADKINKLYKKPPIEVKEPVYPNRIPSLKQQEAIKGALSKWISIIEGGPGTGKTTIMSEIIRTISLMGKKSICLAFTGAATTRIKETTKESGVYDLTRIFTINMAITLIQQIKDMNPDVAIVDEVSMVASGLAADLFIALKRINCSYILIGDGNQLSPVGWGEFMKRLNGTPIQKYKLTENFRSEKTIVRLCQSIIDEERILKHDDVNWGLLGDDYSIMKGDIDKLDNLIERYAKGFKYDDTLSCEANTAAFEKYRDKFTIISPYKKICDQVNPIFQNYFLSKHVTEKIELDGRVFYLGDRVMKLVNDYGIDVMNGEQGKVIKITNNYVVCMFRGCTDTITPYVERSKFVAMKAFVKYNKINFSPYKVTKDGQRIEKTPEEVKFDVKLLRDIYLVPNVTSQKNASKETMELYFELLEEYPHALYDIQREAEFLNITQISHAYALTTHKSQGSQNEYIIFFLNGKQSLHVTVNNVYTAVSRAAKHLDIVVSDITLLNTACITKEPYVNDRLTNRINLAMPPEEVAKLIPEPVQELCENGNGQMTSDDVDDIEYEYEEY